MSSKKYLDNSGLSYFWNKLKAVFAQKSTLATVATSGNYNDLSNKIAVVDSNPTLVWGTTSIVGTVDGTSLQVTMPSAPSGGSGASLSFAAGTVTSNTSQCLMTVAMDTTQRTYAFGEVTSSWAAPSSGTTRTIGLLLVLANDYENYVLVHNADTSNKMALTISSVVDSNNNTISNIIMPSSIPDISAGGYVEMSVVIKEINSTKYAAITFSQEINL